MRILLTRPLEEARATAQHLDTLGHSSISSPLLTIAYRSGPALDLSGIQALVVTSINGARALALRTARRDLPVFAVGTQTTAEVQKSGFTNVENADGDAIALADAIAGWTVPERGPLLHVGGADVTGKLRARLTAHGFDLRREILYEAIAATGLSTEAQEALRKNAIDAVLLYSPRSAEIFARCIVQADLVAQCRSCLAVVISPAAAQKLESLPFPEVRAASHPSEKHLLDRLQR